MKIIRFIGGLGNQMFQYACYKGLQKRYSGIKADLNTYKTDKAHNGYELESIFNLKLNQLSPFMGEVYNLHNRKWIYRKIRRVLDVKKLLKETHNYFRFEPEIFSSSRSGYYSGFWQNEDYFKEISGEIRKDFEFKPLTNQKNIDVINKINQTNSVSIHVRRGDYVDHPSFGGICEKDYYQDSIQYIQLKTNSPKFFVFSNDIDWCIKNLTLNNAEFISWNNGTNSHIDMQLMSACQHNIVANSSFSWWGAWLNNNPDKIVIGPKKWLNEDYNPPTPLLQNWIKL